MIVLEIFFKIKTNGELRYRMYQMKMRQNFVFYHYRTQIYGIETSFLIDCENANNWETWSFGIPVMKMAIVNFKAVWKK